MNIVLFHGTTEKSAKQIKEEIRLDANLHPGDFGAGFYLAPRLEQCIHHANKRKCGKTNENGVILKYEIDASVLKALKPVEFLFKTYDWGEMIYRQRVLEKDTADNVIIGPIADGAIPAIIESCRAGNISKDDFIAAAARGELGIQCAFKTKEAIRHLKLVDEIRR